MKRFRSLIVDDERLARVSLRNKLALFEQFDIVGEATGIASAGKAITELDPDLIFLDIQLTDGDGFDLLKTTKFNGKVVFVTAYDEHAVRAFEINAIDYLLKPVTKTRLKNLLEKLNRDSGHDDHFSISRYNYDDRIMVEQKGFIHFLLVSEIILISSAKDYTIINVVDKSNYIVHTPMTEWEQILPADHFARVHRTAIVNLNHIEKTKRIGATAEIILKNHPTPVRVSRGYYKELKSKYIHK